jgi:hypothetical protein
MSRAQRAFKRARQRGMLQRMRDRTNYSRRLRQPLEFYYPGVLEATYPTEVREIRAAKKIQRNWRNNRLRRNIASSRLTRRFKAIKRWAGTGRNTYMPF